MSAFLRGTTIGGDTAIVAMDHVVSVVGNTADEDNTTIMIRLRDQTHLELAMSADRFWDLI